ncbi:hypothetical protein LIER_14520 [Lithospermum erythrorhizon]|uniref:Uncharacterized protein n=1 Tax=Lithospermum erythrorhizon TaxID=34254 RepID=A0AAV3Q1Z2_LITER
MDRKSIYNIIEKKGNPEAKFMANKEIYNWDDIVMLCGRDRATREGVEMLDEAAETMTHEGYDEEISTHFVQSKNGMGRQSTSSATKVQITSKKTKKDVLTIAVQEVAFSVKQYFESKKKNEDNRPSAKWIRFLLDN